ncbi:MAG: YaiI/YqxD family protein [Proteobacteria bacterium]|nr:YaiI/YqxD family protein [Pseudomonadota bacterium]
MQIWIDGDACPNKIKEILFRAAIRTKIPLVIVANHFLSIPPSPFIKRLQVEFGFDAADKKIAENIKENDLVITADIPLAAEVIAKKAIALNPRGELYSPQNMKQILSMRNFNESLRENRLISGGQAKLSQTEIRNFSNNLDKILAKAKF